MVIGGKGLFIKYSRQVTRCHTKFKWQLNNSIYIGCIKGSMLTSNGVGLLFEPRSGQTKDIRIRNRCFFRLSMQH